MATLIKNAITSWKTTVFGGIPGAVAIVTQLVHLFDGDASTAFDITTFIGAVSLMLAFLAARDGDKTSEASGAK